MTEALSTPTPVTVPAVRRHLREVPLPSSAAPTTRSRTAELQEMRAAARSGPGAKATEAQHARGKLTVHERIEELLDPGSFVELEGLRRHRASGFGMEDKRPHGDGIVTGWGTIDGRRVFVYGSDFRVFGGSLGEAHAAKIHKILDLAEAAGAPVISLNDGAGARIQEGVTGLAGYGGIFQRNVRASGVIPQISVMLGPCAGGAAYSPALTDFVFMVRGTSQMFLTGPDVVQAVTGEQVTHEELGGADVHSRGSGVATFVYDDERTCLADVRHLVSMLPSNNQELPPVAPTADPADRVCEALLDIVPADPARPYDMREVIERDRRRRRVPRAARALGAATSCARWPASTGRWSGSWRTSRWCWPACSTSTPRRRPRGSSRPATRSTSRWSRSSTCRGSCPAPSRSTAAIDPPRREAAVRLLRGDRAAGAGDPAQGVRRRLHRDGLPLDRRRPVVRLADQRDRGDGCRGRGQRDLPQGDRRRRRPGAGQGREDRGVPRAS